MVRRNSFVRALRVSVALHENVLAHIFGRDVVAWRQSGLEQDHWPIRLRDDFTVHADLDVPGALQHVYPVVRIAGVYEDLFVFLVPVIHLPPVEREVARDRRRRLYGVGVRPHGVLGHVLADPYRPVRGLALVGARRRVVRGLEEVHPHVFFGEIVDGQMPRLVHELDAAAVGHGLAAQHHPHPAWGVLKIKHVVTGGLYLEVERLFTLVAERSGPDRQRHSLLLGRLATSACYIPVTPKDHPAPPAPRAYTGPCLITATDASSQSEYNRTRGETGCRRTAPGVASDVNLAGKGKDASGDWHGGDQRRKDLLRGRGGGRAARPRARGDRGQQDVGGPGCGLRQTIQGCTLRPARLRENRDGRRIVLPPRGPARPVGLPGRRTDAPRGLLDGGRGRAGLRARVPGEGRRPCTGGLRHRRVQA